MNELGQTDIYRRGLKEGVDQPNSFESLVQAPSDSTLEMDTILLRDGNIAVVHQKDINRSMEEIEQMDLPEFEKLDQLDRSTGGAISGLKMPLADEISFLASDRNDNLFLELKGSSDQMVIQLFDHLLEMLINLDKKGAYKDNPDFLQKNLSFHSFSVPACEYAVKRIREENIKAPVFLELTSGRSYAEEMEISKSILPYMEGFPDTEDWIEKSILVAKAIGCEGVSMNISNLKDGANYIDFAHKNGLKIFARSTAPIDQDLIEKLKEQGLDSYANENLK